MLFRSRNRRPHRVGTRVEHVGFLVSSHNAIWHKNAMVTSIHRVVENRVLMGEFITKGDANATKDMNPAPYDNFIGKVAYSIPKVGGIALVLTGVYGKILAGGAILGAVILHGIASVINLKREKDEDEAEHLSEKKE